MSEPDQHERATGAGGGAEVAPRPLRAACVVIWLQCLALLAAAGVLVAKTLTGSPNSIGRALFGAALAVLAAVVLALAGRGLFRLRASARTPVLVLELLALPVSYSLGFQAHRIGYGGPILISALAVLYLLFTPPARAALYRDLPGAKPGPGADSNSAPPQ